MTTLVSKYLPPESIRLGVESRVANFTAANGRLYIVNGTVNVQLPAPVANLHFVVKDISGDVGANPITLVRNSTELIDGDAANYVLSSNKQSVSIHSDGTNWFII